jgi:ABC-type glycerol-3-phosphate transport system substrate-binding protein
MKSLTIALLVALLALAGCGGGADTDKPVAEIKQDAETMTVKDLQAKAKSYQDAVTKKLTELEPLKEKLMEIPLTEQMGDEAKALQADIAELTKDLDALKERLKVYVDALKEKGESVQDYLY